MGAGFDIACGIYLRLKTLFDKNLLSTEEKIFWSSFVTYFFIDKLHIKCHVNPICTLSDKGLFHPYLNKFKGILYDTGCKVNDQIAEQMWGILINKFKFIFKSLSMKKAILLSFLLREWVNHEKKQVLSTKHMYWDEDINNFGKLRDMNMNNNHNNNNNNNNMNIPSVDDIKEEVLLSNKIKLKTASRQCYCKEIQYDYTNIFYKQGDIGWVENPLIVNSKIIISSLYSITYCDNNLTNEEIEYYSEEILDICLNNYIIYNAGVLQIAKQRIIQIIEDNKNKIVDEKACLRLYKKYLIKYATNEIDQNNNNELKKIKLFVNNFISEFWLLEKENIKNKINDLFQN